MNHYIYIFSSPKHILTDQGQNFICKLMEEFEQLFKIKHIKTTSFHPQSSERIEQVHGTIKDMIRTNIKQNDTEWDEHLNFISMAYNTSVDSSTNYTPFEFTFGREANLPASVATTTNISKNELLTLWKNRHQGYLNNANKILNKNKKKHKETQDKKIKIKTIYKTNDIVLLDNEHKHDKLSDEWIGPYRIEDV